MSDSKPNTEFSPTIFNDPIAQQTEWKWVNTWGDMTFQEHTLVENKNGNFRFKPTEKGMLPSTIFLLLALLFSIL